MSEFRDWYYRVPFFTRHWLTWTIVLSLFAKFGFIDGFYLRLYLGPFISQFHVSIIQMKYILFIFYTQLIIDM